MCSSRDRSVRLMGPERYAWLSVAAALATIALKLLAWWLTGSVGLLSDALESFVNLAAALLAVSMLRLGAAPPGRRPPVRALEGQILLRGHQRRADRARRGRHFRHRAAAAHQSAAARDGHSW